MKITITEKASSESPVFIIRDGEKIENHPFFKNLFSEDAAYLKSFFHHEKDEKEFEKMLFLPSGKTALAFRIAKDTNHRKMILLARRIIVSGRQGKLKTVSVNFDDFKTKNIADETLAEVLATQCEIANFEFTQNKTKPKEGWFFVEEVFIFKKQSGKLSTAIKTGKIIGEEINKARIISNMPGADLTPKILAEFAQKSAQGTDIHVKILDEKEIKKLGMGGVIGVGKGSIESPRFIIMEYWGGKKHEKPIVLVGKGVTFDTGGLSLKPSNHMYEMHMDMTGGASAIHTLVALARIGVKKNIIVLVPAVENAASGASYRPGDILKSMSGKMIEVIDTDAEGRIILADALTYANRYKPELVIDMATLTGAAEVALGQRASAIFSEEKNTALIEKMRASGEVTGDFVWQLPLWSEYENDIKGTFGDIVNYAKGGGGAITAAAFLWQFAKEYPWIHIDTAPRMTSIDGEFLAKGSAGPAIALLTNFLRE